MKLEERIDYTWLSGDKGWGLEMLPSTSPLLSFSIWVNESADFARMLALPVLVWSGTPAPASSSSSSESLGALGLALAQMRRMYLYEVSRSLKEVKVRSFSVPASLNFIWMLELSFLLIAVI